VLCARRNVVAAGGQVYEGDSTSRCRVLPAALERLGGLFIPAAQATT